MNARRAVMVLMQSVGAAEEGGLETGREGAGEEEAVLMRVLVRCLPTERETIGE